MPSMAASDIKFRSADPIGGVGSRLAVCLAGLVAVPWPIAGGANASAEAAAIKAAIRTNELYMLTSCGCVGAGNSTRLVIANVQTACLCESAAEVLSRELACCESKQRRWSGTQSNLGYAVVAGASGVCGSIAIVIASTIALPPPLQSVCEPGERTVSRGRRCVLACCLASPGLEIGNPGVFVLVAVHAQQLPVTAVRGIAVMVPVLVMHG